MEKIAVFAPMPSAKVSTAIAANPGALASTRNAYFTSWIKPFMSASLVPQCDHGIDLRRSARRQVARDKRYGNQHAGNSRVRQRIRRTDAKEHVGQRARQHKRKSQPNRYARRREDRALTQHQRENSAGLRAERHANAKFMSALTRGVRQHAVNSHRR